MWLTRKYVKSVCNNLGIEYYWYRSKRHNANRALDALAHRVDYCVHVIRDCINCFSEDCNKHLLKNREEL